MAIIKEAKTLTFGDTQYVVVDAEAREKIAELEQSANETLPALKQQIETHSSDNNAHSDIRDAIPTKVSQLANDSQFITQESDPTVPSWAKQETKPEYTASEVGAEPAGTSSTVVSQHNTSNVAHTDIRNEVKALNDEFASHEHNNTYDSKGSAESALTEAKSYTNSKTANLASNASVSTSVNNHNTNAEAHNDIRLELKVINDRLNAFFDSDDKTLDELSEIVAYITNNKTLIDSITTSKVNVEDIINNLTTNVANKPLSAAQGVALKGLIDSVSTSLSNYQPKGNYALKSELPTKVSQLSNDSGYLTEHQDISGKLDSSALPTAINTALAQAKASGEFDGKDGTSVTVKSVSESTSDGGTNTITFSDGKTIDIKNGSKGSNGSTGSAGKDGTSVTVKNVSESTADGGSNVVTFSDGKTLTVKNGSKGSKGDTGANGKTPVKGTDYWTEADKQEMVEELTDNIIVQESGQSESLVMSQKAVTNYVDAEIDDLKASSVQQHPLFANSIEECTDTDKMYVLPDGFTYAYQYVEATGPAYTNLSETVHENYRMGSSGALSDLTGGVTTDFIPVKKGQKVRFKGFDPTKMPSDKTPYICFYTGASESSKVSSGVWDRLDWMIAEGRITQDSHGAWVYTAFMSPENNPTYPCEHPLSNSITHIRLCGAMITGETVIVTVDEEITEGGSTGGYAWVSTGHAFVPADYEAEILALQKNKADKAAIPTKLPNPNALTIDGVPYDGSAAVNIEIQSGGNILYGKKWVACGDSFTENGYNASDGFDESVYIYQDGRFAGRYKVYPHIIGLRNNMNVVNLATGGQTMANSSNSFMTRYANIDADADYITIMLGINDKIQGISVGAIDSTDKATFCGAFNVAMEHILENHPFAHIGIMVSHGTNEEIMEATRGIAERWGVPYLDYGSPQVPLMNRYTGRNVCAKAQQIREKNFCVISDGTNATNGHPNTAAHEYESTFIEAWLRTL